MKAHLSVVIAVVVVFACFAAGEETTTASPCAAKFKEDQKRLNVSEACLEKTGLKPEDMPESEEEFTKTFNDKCYGKCLLSELGMLKDLKFDRDAIKADIIEHVLDKDFQTKITDYTMKCLDDEEKAAGTITEDNVCKLSAKVLYCCKKEEQKLPC